MIKLDDGLEYISNNLTDSGYEALKDKLMASVEFQSYDESTGLWYIGKLANGETNKLSILAKVTYIGSRNASASISIMEDETDCTNNNASVTVVGVDNSTEDTNGTCEDKKI